MKKWKQRAASLLALLVLSGVGLHAHAAGLHVNADKTQVQTGDTITVTLSLDADLEQVICFEYRIYYDAAKFTLDSTSSAIGSACPSAMISKSEMTYGIDARNCCSVSFVDSTSNGQKVSKGTVASLTFTAKADLDEDWKQAFAVERAHFAKADMWTSLMETEDADVTYDVQVTPEALYGDVNGDGSVDNFDVNVLYRYCTGTENLESGQETAADVNGDGSVDNLDVTILYQYVVGTIDRFPVQTGNE